MKERRTSSPQILELDLPGKGREKQERKSDRLLWLSIALLFVTLLLGALWLFYEPNEAEKEREQAHDELNYHLEHPPTSAGTLAGRVVRSEINLAGMLLPDGRMRKKGESVLRRVDEDSRISRTFVEDLASFFVKSFVPGESGGTFKNGLGRLNQHFGNRLNLEPEGGCRTILRYAFPSSMLKALYRFYVTYFLECLERDARESFEIPVVRAFLGRLAEQSEMLSRTINFLFSQQNLTSLLARYEQKAELCESIGTQITLLQYDMDTLDARGGSEEEQKSNRTRMRELEASFQSAQKERNEEIQLLLRNLKRGKPPLDDENLLFLVFWMHRRLLQEENAQESFEACVEILEDLSLRLRDLSESRLEAPQEEVGEAQKRAADEKMDDFSEKEGKKEEPSKQEADSRASLIRQEDLEKKGKNEEKTPPDDGLPQTIQVPIRF